MNDANECATHASLAARFSCLWEAAESPPELQSFVAQQGQLSTRELADVVLVDQLNRWRKGTPTRAEAYFDEWPELSNDPETRLDLVYGEFRARLRSGETPLLADFISRFPDVEDGLRRQVEVGSWLHVGPASLEDTKRDSDSSSVSDSADTGTESELVDPRAPLSLDGFELGECVGVGGIGKVYRAVQKSLNKVVAVKILRNDRLVDHQCIERFLREGRDVASLRHPSIVDVHGIGRCRGGGYFLVMDFVEGASLQERIRRGPLSVEEAVRITIKVAEAIEEANNRGIVHRDLKPSNVLLDNQGQAMVSDFGLAKHFLHDEETLSSGGQIHGTPQYMAPEQANRDLGKITPATDVYGLGALLYAFLVGKPPIEGSSQIEVLGKIVSGHDPLAPRSLRPEIPKCVESVCLKCLAKNPGDRYRTARQVVDALGACEASRIGADASDSVKGAPRRAGARSRVRHHVWVALAIGGVLVLAGWAAMRFQNGLKTTGTGSSETSSASGNGATARKSSIGEVTWTFDVFRAGHFDRRECLTERPGPVFTGDHVRMEIEFSRPLHVYVYWVGSEGSVGLIHPTNLEHDEPVSRITIPSERDFGLPIRGPAGTELCVLVLRESRLDKPEGIVSTLEPSQPLPPLETSMLLLDGNPVAQKVSRESPAADEGFLAELASDSRSVGPPEPLQKSPVVKAITRTLAKIPKSVGEVRYLAILHGGST